MEYLSFIEKVTKVNKEFPLLHAKAIPAYLKNGK